MKQVLIREGAAEVVEVPAPSVGRKNVLVRVAYSCISVGTEMAGVQNSGMPLYRRALKQPENVRRVLEMARSEGVARTLARVRSKLLAGTPSGYSASGAVIAVGEEVAGFVMGDRVACAGAGIANHAEVIDVPVNLAVKIPDAVSLDCASTVTLGAIAMQGVRRATPTLGETFVVVGLGVLGQLTVQLLTANGCRVIGVDVDEGRVRTALGAGMDFGVDPTDEDYVDRVQRLTHGLGADGAIVTAATASSDVISAAMKACRKKGRVVLVGDVGLNLNRSDFYSKELDFLISTSYGPGRYDPSYEAEGIDYPLPYVRWTENRNMEAYLRLLESGKVQVGKLFSVPYPIERAADAYTALKSESDRPLLALLSYPDRASAMVRTVPLSTGPERKRAIRVALAGASSFAQSTHLPNLRALSESFSLRAVMSRTGSTARSVAEQYGAAYCTTDFGEILADEQTDLVLIATRHDLHAEMTLKALRAGKHVFVEKPLALRAHEIDEIEQFYKTASSPPLLMVGYNRRFSPALRLIREVIAGSATPIIANYRMNAGYLPPDHWVHGAEGGGRNIGEACHIYDLFNSLCEGRKVASVHASGITPRSRQWSANDNFVATLKYEDGSICSLTYTALGDRSYPKERMDLFADGLVIEMEDYKSVSFYGRKRRNWSSRSPQKGQREELVAVADSLLREQPWPIALTDQLQSARTSLEIERQLFAVASHPDNRAVSACAE